MASRLPMNAPAFLTLAVSSAMGIILLTGCPQQQVPNQVSDSNDTNVPVDSNTVDANGPGRPIPGVTPTPDDTTAPDGGGNTGGDANQPASGGGTELYSVRYSAPENPLAVRPSTAVDVIYKLNDALGVVTGIDFVIGQSDAQGNISGDPAKVGDVTPKVGSNTLTYDTKEALDNGRLVDGFGRFRLGLRVRTTLGKQDVFYATGVITIDAVKPNENVAGKDAWKEPNQNLLLNPTTWNGKVYTTDNAAHTVRILLDTDTDATNGYSGILVPTTEFAKGSGDREFKNVPLSIAAGHYFYRVEISDGIGDPTAFYAPNLTLGGDEKAQILVTKRIIGTFNLSRLDPSSNQYDNYGLQSMGAILQGFNFSDLAGSAMAGVPDLNNDGHAELLVASRFGKPYGVNTNGIGFGEAYMIYGNEARLRDKIPLNSVGGGAVSGLVFPGIRCPIAGTWTHGMSDVTVIPDMDGDDLPELVFSFPRAESVSLANVSPAQHPELNPDYPGMGALEYDAWDHDLGQWQPNEAQFTRGGIVIVSSHSPMLQDPTRLNRKGNRLLDLAEVGQLFDDTRLPTYRRFIWRTESEDATTLCPAEDPNSPPQDKDYKIWTVWFDLCFENQGPGGFDNYFSAPQFFGLPYLDTSDPNRPHWYWEPDPYQPPLANIRPLLHILPEDPNTGDPRPAVTDPCGTACVVYNIWEPYRPFPVQNTLPASLLDPDPFMYNTQSWHGSFAGQFDPNGPYWLSRRGEQSGLATWTGFCGKDTARVIPSAGGNELGARVLGQRREDRFGTTIGVDGTWLYISAPGRTALQAGDNVPSLEADRSGAGVVYQLRTNAKPYNNQYTVTQLWIEPDVIEQIDPNDPNYPDDPNDPNTPPYIVHTFPYPDHEMPWRADEAMPTPHQYIIENNGYTRGGDKWWPELTQWAPRPPPPSLAAAPAEVNSEPLTDHEYLVNYLYSGSGCLDGWVVEDYMGVPADAVEQSPNWPHYSSMVAEYYIDRTPQIVGPHTGAHLSFVRGLGDLNGDKIADFAVGSADVLQNFSNPQSPTGSKVGAVFVVFGRQTGLEGDYLLDRMALQPSDDARVHGVLIRGTDPNDQLGGVFDRARDFDGDGFEDVVVGAPGARSGRGQVTIILGSSTLESPVGGWTTNDALTAQRAVRFSGAKVGDLAGANVADAGDVDGDGRGDILIAAPGAENNVGVTYLIYGSPTMRGQDLDLADVGSFKVPGVKFVGRRAGDRLGGGQIRFPQDRPGVTLNPNGDPVTALSRGVVALGDIDGDGKGDFAISAMLASPDNKAAAGEVYIIYGKGD